MLKGIAGKRKRGICNIAEVMSVYQEENQWYEAEN